MGLDGRKKREQGEEGREQKEELVGRQEDDEMPPLPAPKP